MPRSHGHRSGGGRSRGRSSDKRSDGKRSHGHRSGGHRSNGTRKRSNNGYGNERAYGSTPAPVPGVQGGFGPMSYAPLGGGGGAPVPVQAAAYGTMDPVGANQTPMAKPINFQEATAPPPVGWQALSPAGLPDVKTRGEGTKYFWILIWLAGNVTAFYLNYTKWRNKKQLFDILDLGLPLARGPAATIYINVGLIFLLLSRNLILFLRGTWVNEWIPFDKNVTWHKMCAMFMALGATLHTSAHYFNMHKISKLNPIAPPEGLPPNLVLPVYPDRVTLSFMTLPGLTGHVMLACLALMYTSGWKKNKRNGNGHFELFWYTHQLWVVFMSCYLVHGTGELLGSPAKGWVYAAVPLGIYVLERMLRIRRAYTDTRIVKVVAHPSDVVEIQFQQNGFVYKTGHYLFMSCPAVSRMQWHPFTISSAPEDPYVSVHIRKAGDWTTMLHQVLVPSLRKDKAMFQQLDLTSKNVVMVDGPFGAASEEWINFKVAILVGAGVGVTPFASILRSLRARVTAASQSGMQKTAYVQIRKVYFFWICKDFGTFTWIKDLLMELEAQNVDNLIDIRIHLTVKFDQDQVQRIATDTGTTKDPVTGLRATTRFGRPDWAKEFYDLYKLHAGNEIGVFVCGPGALSKSLRVFSAKYSDPTGYTTFKFHKENF